MSKKTITILGGGESGVGAAVLAQKMAYKVWVSDNSAIKEKYKKKLENLCINYEENTHDIDKILSSDVVVKSPGIPNNTITIQKIKNQHIEIIDEVEFAYQHKNINSTIIGVTGSNGKTTTASLIYHILKNSGSSVALVGNVGYSFAYQIATDPKEFYVVELSSFQLEYIKTFRSHVSIILNITPDHLNRYDNSLQQYANAKWEIIKNSTSKDYIIHNQDDEIIKKMINICPPKGQLIPISIMNDNKPQGAYARHEQLSINLDNNTLQLSMNDTHMQGKHAQYNTMAAAVATQALGIKKESIKKAILSFRSIDHRMESVATFGGVTFINDSKATNINSTWYALESMQKPVVLIMGGTDKGNAYNDLLYLIEKKVKGIVCIGVDNEKIKDSFIDKVPCFYEVTSMKEAVNISFNLANSGDVVLLSPACASFDRFKDYVDRGNQFKEAIAEL